MKDKNFFSFPTISGPRKNLISVNMFQLTLTSIQHPTYQHHLIEMTCIHYEYHVDVEPAWYDFYD